jgi:alanine-glyoxylate transaminase / serine-glyoxylate transaminase / serine-pyruvate transaminase
VTDQFEGGELLLIPGPVTVTKDVLAALARPVPAHYGPEWVEFYRKVCADMARVFSTDGDVFLLYGPGSAGLEMAVASVLARGDRILVVGGGFFGDRLEELSVASGLIVRRVRPRAYEPVVVADVAAVLDRDPEIRAVAVVHHQTDMGLINPLQAICGLARGRGLVTIVDGVSSVGGVPLEMDAWGIDVCVTVANKCLGAPIGVSPVAVGPGAWAAVDDGRPKAAGAYLNLAAWRHALHSMEDWHPYPTTIPTNNIVALGVALDQLRERGLERHLELQAGAARRVREGLRELGFRLLADEEWASPVTTAVWAREGMDLPDYMEWLRLRRGLRVAGGLGELAGRIFRVGHMGEAANPEVVDAFLLATGEYLQERDTKV